MRNLRDELMFSRNDLKTIHMAASLFSMRLLPRVNISPICAASNALSMPSTYIESSNFTAGGRKLFQAIASINQLQLEG